MFDKVDVTKEEIRAEEAADKQLGGNKPIEIVLRFPTRGGLRRAKSGQWELSLVVGVVEKQEWEQHFKLGCLP